MGLHLGCWNLFATAVVGLLVTFLPEGYAIPIPIAAILLLDMIYFVIAATRVYGQGSFVLIWKWLILQAVMLFYFVVAGIVLAIMAFSQ